MLVRLSAAGLPTLLGSLGALLVLLHAGAKALAKVNKALSAGEAVNRRAVGVLPPKAAVVVSNSGLHWSSSLVGEA